MRTLVLLLSAALSLSVVGSAADAQTVVASRLRGPTATNDLKLSNVQTTGGNQFVFRDATTESLISRALARADLAAAVAYEDEANTFTLNQTFNGDIAVNGGDITASAPLNIRPTGNLNLDPTGDLIV